MNISATVPLPMPPTQVWACLTNPEHLSRCVPGLHAWSVIAPQQTFSLLIAWQLGPNLPIELPVTIQWTHLYPPKTMQQEAQILFNQEIITIDCVVELLESNGKQTYLQFSADITLPNKFLEQVVRNTAPKMIDKFFKAFKTNCATKIV